ncbi:MAG: transglutaminase domain-containing protein, partial [Clostridia bacterium]|nr:transglutaminase domain-containing protein [Clostridia bacterium]
RDFSALRVLLPAALAVIVALMLSPANRVTWPPLEAAANRVRAVFEQYFRFTEERVAFSINQEGYDHAGKVGDSVVAMLGGPAEPHTAPVMAVQTDAEVLLRGTIRTAYTGYSWVDAAPKNRYLYFDLTHAFIRDRVFNAGFSGSKEALLPAEVSVEMLDAGTSTLFVPGRLDRFNMDLSSAVYYNTAGEMFLSREVRAGDAYSLRALQPALGDALREAVLRGESANDDRYQEAVNYHTQLPEGIEGGVYALTMQVIDGAETPYDRAVAILEYLRRNIRYTLDTEYPPQGRDFVSYFLLDSKEGYCSYYASAMAVMGRIAGLPTRYVEGYLARPGKEILTGEDAHAWAEVYFKGVGWIPFDATGGATGRAGLPEENLDQGAGGGQDQGDSIGQGESDYDGPEPTPTPTPTPEPDGGLQDDAPTPSPEPQDAPAEATEPPEEAPESEPDDPPGPRTEKSDLRWLWWALGILLVLALIALATLWVRARLRRANPARLAGEAKTARQAAMIVYRANLTLLSHMGQTPVNGETPEAFAARVSGQFKNPEYADFARAVAAASYGRKPLNRADIENGLRAYVGFSNAMGRREKLRFTLTRIFRGLGDFEAIP